MYQAISLEGFRGFEKFSLSGLGRINLLVGANNSGKTSILEAVGLLASRGDPRHLFATLLRRGEFVWSEGRGGRITRTPRVRHLFKGHTVAAGTSANISGDHVDRQHDEVRMSVAPYVEGDHQLRFEGIAETPHALVLAISNGRPNGESRIPLTDGGDVDPEWSRRRSATSDDVAPAAFISTASLGGYEVLQLASALQLSEEEGRVLEALRVIEPAIEAFRPMAPRRPYMSDAVERDGIIVKLQGIKEPVPIGSLGDGTWRMLGIALAIASSADKVLLVDEIDTGLHYSVMVDMWRLVLATATRLGVQVFATTHSRDCLEALAVLVREGKLAPDDVTIQRVERTRSMATSFGEQEILAAADRGIEIR
jgi:AAA domain, putative AbiEii toxin, Type IV TA system/AAA ATPase domain